MSAVMKAQNRHIYCWDQADMLLMTGAMLGGTVMKHCVLADIYCSLSAAITQTEVEKFLAGTTQCRSDMSLYIPALRERNAQLELACGTKWHAKGWVELIDR